MNYKTTDESNHKIKSTTCLTKEESDRIKIVKFLAIILVVYLHAYTTEIRFADGNGSLYLPIWLQLIQDGLSQVIARSGVPTFFLISSILFFKSEQTYGNMIKKKAKTLLLPYLIWNTFWIAVFIFMQSLPFTAVYFTGSCPLVFTEKNLFRGLFWVQ